MDPNIVIELLIAGFAVIVAAYIISLLVHKRMMDSVQATAAATLAATQSLIALNVYYGAYERAEVLRTVASVISVDQIRDTALEFQNQRCEPPYKVEVYPPPPPSQVTARTTQ